MALTQQAPRACGDDHHIRRSQLLKARGQIGRFADDLLLLGGSMGDEIADYHEPRRYADPCGEVAAERTLQFSDGLHNLEAGPDSALSLVLMGSGPSEISQDAIPHEPSDIACEP